MEQLELEFKTGWEWLDTPKGLSFKDQLFEKIAYVLSKGYSVTRGKHTVDEFPTEFIIYPFGQRIRFFRTEFDLRNNEVYFYIDDYTYTYGDQITLDGQLFCLNV